MGFAVPSTQEQDRRRHKGLPVLVRRICDSFERSHVGHTELVRGKVEEDIVEERDVEERDVED